MNKSKYVWKDIPGSSHQIFLARIHALGSELKVLDIGTGRGELGRRIRSRCQLLVGIEKDPITAEIARPFYDDLIIGSVTETNISWIEPFDLIILGDILEHLAEPGNYLKKIRSYLKDNGHILISVPNVANITVRLGLLIGRFDYQSRGILDRTHLHFYTLKSAREEIEKAGYLISRTRATPMPVELALPFLAKTPFLSGVRLATQFLTNVFPRLFGYQFFFEAIPIHIEQGDV